MQLFRHFLFLSYHFGADCVRIGTTHLAPSPTCHTTPHCHPPPPHPQGLPPQIRGHSCSREFSYRKWRFPGGGYLLEGVYREKIWQGEFSYRKRKNAGGYPKIRGLGEILSHDGQVLPTFARISRGGYLLNGGSGGDFWERGIFHKGVSLK